MKRIKKYCLWAALCAGLSAAGTGCTDLDIPPKNLVSDETLLSNEAGMQIYLARMYSNMPWEHFKYMASRGTDGFTNSWLTSPGVEGTGEALTRDDIFRAFYNGNDYWGDAFALLRDANHLIENLPKYGANFSEVMSNHFLGEAYFVRAFVFYKMAARYGGIPLVTREIPYPAEKSELEVPRSTEEESWDQVLADFDKAAELMMETSPKRGNLNKYVALAYQSEAMLYAGCVAKYNETVDGRLTGFGEKTQVRVIGFAEDAWNAAARRYFRRAYTAANEVIASGRYALQMAASNNPEDLYKNMVDLFSNTASREHLYIKEYVYPTMTHGDDAYNSPYIFRSPLSSGACPSLDFVELFDGFERYANGTIKTTDGTSQGNGNYLPFNTPMDFFATAEPRLRAYVIFPSDIFRNTEIEIRAGTYTGAFPRAAFNAGQNYSTSGTTYPQANISGLAQCATPTTRKVVRHSGTNNIKYVNNGDTSIYASGDNGPFTDFGESAITGFYRRKWLQPSPAVPPAEGMSAQPFILMRYAEVLLNAAEAAVELSLMGESSPDGSDMIAQADNWIKEIQQRAGAVVTPITGDLTGLGLVRKERRKELAFEFKTMWDLRRWRVWHYGGRSGFWGVDNPDWVARQSENNNYRFRGLYPFFSTQAGKWFFDGRIQAFAQRTCAYVPHDYYFAIPGGEVTKSPVIDQQPNR